MSQEAGSASTASSGGPVRPRPSVLRGESKKKLVEDARRNKFKDRAKDLERGVSTPALLPGTPGTPKAPLPLNEEEVITVGQGMGHQFAKKTFFQPTYCHHCAELLWGIKGQGYLCQGKGYYSFICYCSSPTIGVCLLVIMFVFVFTAVCNYVSHEKCVPFLKTPCRHIVADSIQVSAVSFAGCSSLECHNSM